MSRDWTRQLRSSMPLAAAMAVEASIEADGRVRLGAPLAPNVNDKGTAFGGSVATLATLAGWVEAQRQLDLAGSGDSVDIVIQRGETRYLKPIQDQFHAVARPLAPEAVQYFLRLYARKGLARLTVTVGLYCQDQHVGEFHGDYVASRNSS